MSGRVPSPNSQQHVLGHPVRPIKRINVLISEKNIPRNDLIYETNSVQLTSTFFASVPLVSCFAYSGRRIDIPATPPIRHQC